MSFGMTNLGKALKIALFLVGSYSASAQAECTPNPIVKCPTPQAPPSSINPHPTTPAAPTLPVTSSTECPTLSLLQSAPQPLRVSAQLHGTCSVHATVRALDHLNYTTGHSSQNTSILATIMSLNSGSTDNFISTENSGRGFEAGAVIRHLQQFGGCKETPWDRLPENGGEAQLDRLNTAVPEINNILDAMTTSSNPQQLLSNLGETSRYLLTQAAQSQNLSHVAQDLKNSRGTFMGLANAIFKKAFCQGSSLSYTAFNSNPVYIVDNFNNMPSTSTLRDSIRNQLALSNPQPLIASMHANFLMNLNMYDYNSPHRVLIVGQKFSGGQCKYQLLNSWTSTTAYDPSLEADYVTGSVWVPLEELHKKLYRIISIRPQ